MYMGTPAEPLAHAIANAKPQLVELPGKVACKVRDTIAGLVAAYRASAEVGDATWLSTCVKALLDSGRGANVVVWIVEPPTRPGVPREKEQTNRVIRGKRIRAALAWFKARVSVVDPTRDACPTALRVQRLRTGR